MGRTCSPTHSLFEAAQLTLQLYALYAKYILRFASGMRLRWSRGSVLAFGTQVRGFKPGRSRRIFKGEKNPQHAFLRRGSKAVCPMLQICGM